MEDRDGERVGGTPKPAELFSTRPALLQMLLEGGQLGAFQLPFDGFNESAARLCAIHINGLQ